MVGVIIDVGRGKTKVSEVKEILEARDIRKAYKLAPPHGLYLQSITY